MKYKNGQTSEHCIMSKREGMFHREGGRGNTTGREPLRQEALTLLPSSFWQNVYPVPTPLAFYCETLKINRQFLSIKHTVRDYFKTISCLLTLHLWSSLIKCPRTDRLLQVPGTQHISYRQKQKGEELHLKRNKRGGLPKTFSRTWLVFPSAYLNPVISSANGRKI